MKLSSQGYPKRKRLPIRQMSVIEAINAVHAAWNTTQPFFFSGGVFYWGEKPEQSKIYTFDVSYTHLDVYKRQEETVENKGGDGEAVIRVARGVFIFENSTSRCV